MGRNADGGIYVSQILIDGAVIGMTGLAAATALFMKFAPYVIGIKLCTSAIDLAVTYVKHRITKE